MDKVTFGNFNDEARSSPWVVGYNVGELRNNEVSIKWGRHLKGEKKKLLTANSKSKTIGILLSGKIKVIFPETGMNRILEKEGDYVYLPPDTKHGREVLEDSFMISIRWPGIDDQY